MYGEIPGDERANKNTDPVLSNSIYHEEWMHNHKTVNYSIKLAY